MTTLYAQSTGNHSEIIWNTASNGSGTNEIPTAADTLVSNSYTITIADNLTVVKVTNTGGGTFKLSNGITLTCTDGTAGVVGDASDAGAITFDLDSPNAATLAAKVLGGNGSKEWGINFMGTGQLTINGSVTGGSFSGASATGADGVYMPAAGTLIVSNGTSNAVVGGSGAYGRGVNCTAATGATITITGNVTGGGSYALYATGAATITITGNLTGGGNGASALYATGAATITITGTVTGGTNSAYCLYATGAATITITGNLTGGSSSYALYATGAATITITGTLQASASAAALSSTSASAKIALTGPLLSSSTAHGTANASGVNPVYAMRWWPKETAIGTFYYELRGDAVVDGVRPARTLYVAEGVTGDNSLLPVPANVRHGISYAVNNALTGTCHVPPAASVLYGVPVDATTGTAEVSGSDPTTIAAAVWDHLLVDMDTSNSAGARLKQLASTDTVGGIVAALGV